jgi:hypothetical protein
MKDTEPDVRSTAATAHSQLAERRPEATKKVSDSLKRALRKEQDEVVAAGSSDFGLEEAIGEDDFAGDAERAKTRALQKLS